MLVVGIRSKVRWFGAHTSPCPGGFAHLQLTSPDAMVIMRWDT